MPATVTIRALPRPTVSLAKPVARRDRKRRVLAWEISEMLDRDFDDMEICGSLAAIR